MSADLIIDFTDMTLDGFYQEIKKTLPLNSDFSDNAISLVEQLSIFKALDNNNDSFSLKNNSITIECNNILKAKFSVMRHFIIPVGKVNRICIEKEGAPFIYLNMTKTLKYPQVHIYKESFVRKIMKPIEDFLYNLLKI